MIEYRFYYVLFYAQHRELWSNQPNTLMSMTPSLFLVQRYLPSNDFTNDENSKSLTIPSSPFLVHTGTLLPQEVGISVLLGLIQDGLPSPLHLLHLTVKEESTGLYSVVVNS